MEHAIIDAVHGKGSSFLGPLSKRHRLVVAESTGGANLVFRRVIVLPHVQSQSWNALLPDPQMGPRGAHRGKERFPRRAEL